MPNRGALAVMRRIPGSCAGGSLVGSLLTLAPGGGGGLHHHQRRSWRRTLIRDQARHQRQRRRSASAEDFTMRVTGLRRPPRRPRATSGDASHLTPQARTASRKQDPRATTPPFRPTAPEPSRWRDARTCTVTNDDRLHRSRRSPIRARDRPEDIAVGTSCVTGSDVDGGPLTFSLLSRPTRGTLAGAGAEPDVYARCKLQRSGRLHLPE